MSPGAIWVLMSHIPLASLFLDQYPYSSPLHLWVLPAKSIPEVLANITSRTGRDWTLVFFPAQKFKHGGCLITGSIFKFSLNPVFHLIQVEFVENWNHVVACNSRVLLVSTSKGQQDGRAFFGKSKEPPHTQGWSLILDKCCCN